jgi:hypothetical protein
MKRINLVYEQPHEKMNHTGEKQLSGDISLLAEFVLRYIIILNVFTVPLSDTI